MSEVDWQEVAMDSPWTVVMEALAWQSRGEALTDELSDAVYMAGAGLAAASLVRLGGKASTDAVIRQFEEREHSIRLTYEPTTGDVGIAVEWEDGTVTEEKRPLPGQPAAEAADVIAATGA